ncbi:MAG: hypothetical protein ACT4PI_12820 [Actinomycetota bacterium]
MTGTEGTALKLDPRLDQAISRLMDAATWVARVLLPLALVLLVGAVAVFVALPAQWLNDGGWHLVVAIVAGVALVYPGVSALRVRSGLRDAAAHEDTVKRDVVRLLAASSEEAGIRARISDALERLQGPHKLRAIASVGRELLPLAKAARKTHERYEALVEAFGPAGLGALWVAVLTNSVVIVGAPIAVAVGLVLWLI